MRITNAQLKSLIPTIESSTDTDSIDDKKVKEIQKAFNWI